MGLFEDSEVVKRSRNHFENRFPIYYGNILNREGTGQGIYSIQEGAQAYKVFTRCGFRP